MTSLPVIVTALWAMLPAYVPNNVAVLAGGGRPIDGGREWRGRRLLGDGKTWRGTLAGTAAGVGVALVLNPVADPVGTALGVRLPRFPINAGFGLAFGAMLGDIAASFIKRRSGRRRGAAFPGLDQLDFVIGALACVALTAPGWVATTFTPVRILVVIIATPLLHVATNAIAYVGGLKDEPY